jgi:hypothetical protein
MTHTVGERWWKNAVFCVFSVAVMEVFLGLRLGVIVIPVMLFGVRGCRCLTGLDCRRQEVDGTYGG